MVNDTPTLSNARRFSSRFSNILFSVSISAPGVQVGCGFLRTPAGVWEDSSEPPFPPCAGSVVAGVDPVLTLVGVTPAWVVTGVVVTGVDVLTGGAMVVEAGGDVVCVTVEVTGGVDVVVTFSWFPAVFCPAD